MIASRQFRGLALVAVLTGTSLLMAAEPAGPELKKPSLPPGLAGSQKEINERLMRDLDPAKNAAVDVMQILGIQTFEEELRENAMDALGVKAFSEEGPRLASIEPYAIDRFPDALEQAGSYARLLYGQLEFASDQPWKKAERPELAEYLESQQQALDALSPAIAKGRYYAPLLSLEEPPRLFSASFAVERRLPFVTRLLCARAALRAGSGDEIGATRDLRTAHQLAELLVRESPFDVSSAKAHAIDSIACHTTYALLRRGAFSPATARSHLAEVRALREFPSPSIAANVGERAILHQEIELLRDDEESVRGFLEVGDDPDQKPVEMPDLTPIPWELAFQEADKIQDRVVAALAIRDRKEQFKACAEIDKAYEEWTQNDDAQTRKIAQTAKENPAAAARWIGETMAMSLRPDYYNRRETDDRTRSRRHMLELSLALVMYRGQHGEFPASLDQLVPALLPAIPLDDNCDKPYHYTRTADQGCRLTSWGTDGADNAGQTFNDDLIIELPAK